MSVWHWLTSWGKREKKHPPKKEAPYQPRVILWRKGNGELLLVNNPVTGLWVQMGKGNLSWMPTACTIQQKVKLYVKGLEVLSLPNWWFNSLAFWKFFLICQSNMLDVFCLTLWSHSILFSALSCYLPEAEMYELHQIFSYLWLLIGSGQWDHWKKNYEPEGPSHMGFMCACSEGHRTFKEPMSQGLVITPSSCQFKWKSSKNALLLLASW